MERTKTVTNHRGRVNVGVSRVARLEAALAAAGTAKPQDTPFSSLPVALLTMNGYSMDTEISSTFDAGSGMVVSGLAEENGMFMMNGTIRTMQVEEAQ